MDFDSVPGDEREIRAARNQSLFRAINEKLVALNEAFISATDTFVISCECAEVTCVATLEIGPDAYKALRANPRQFAVLKGHVYPDVENVAAEMDTYVIVEKTASGATLAEELAR